MTAEEHNNITHHHQKTSRPRTATFATCTVLVNDNLIHFEVSTIRSFPWLAIVALSAFLYKNCLEIQAHLLSIVTSGSANLNEPSNHVSSVINIHSRTHIVGHLFFHAFLLVRIKLLNLD
jgi:hypothetical protein